jgi:sulfur carrier protein
MNITLNGNEQEISTDTNILQLLDTLDLAGKPVVIEHNKVAIFPRDYPNICLKENDQIEIINIAAGG